MVRCLTIPSISSHEFLAIFVITITEKKERKYELQIVVIENNSFITLYRVQNLPPYF